MRSILLILLMPISLLGQSHISAGSIVQEPSNRWRLGLSLHRDNGLINPYAKTRNLITLRLQRPENVLLSADYRLFKSADFFWITAEVGYYDIAVENRELIWLEVNRWLGPDFFEWIEMQYLHTGLGVWVEPFGQTRFSPYLGGQLQIAFPTELEYRLAVLSQNLSTPAEQSQIEGGQQVSIGWEVSAGLRAQLSRRFSASVGFYFSYMDFQANWPVQQWRNFPDGFLRLDKGGVEIRCMYAL